jgi:hypothetical protein
LYGNKENSAETAQKYKNAEINLGKAYDAYEAGDLEKTKYYLNQSEKKGVVSPGFYFLLGQYFYKRKIINMPKDIGKEDITKDAMNAMRKLQQFLVIDKTMTTDCCQWILYL